MFCLTTFIDRILHRRLSIKLQATAVLKFIVNIDFCSRLTAWHIYPNMLYNSLSISYKVSGHKYQSVKGCSNS